MTEKSLGDNVLKSRDRSDKNITKKESVLTKKITSYFKEYCDSTSIHGFRYFGEHRTICEKIWWFIIFVICLIFCAFSIFLVYRKWDQSPVIVSFSTRDKSINGIPFPAVTVCSESKVRHDVFDYKSAVIRKRKENNLTETEESYLDTLSYICNYPSGVQYAEINNSRPEEFLDILRKVSPEFTIINCMYVGVPYSCQELFKPIITDEGLCYTFNLLDRTEIYNENVVHYRQFHEMNETSENWSIHDGYGEKANIFTYPHRALLAGAKWGLRFELKTENTKLDTMCRGSVEGYRILFHSPIRVPKLSLQYLLVPYNRAMNTAIRVSEITTSKAVRNHPAQKRHCYFPSEKKLKYFKTYSQNNCLTECLTNYMLERCKCVLFYMPRENGTRICQGADYTCAQEAEFVLTFMRLSYRINKTWPSQYGKKYICNCMPMCSDISYTIGTSQSSWDWKEEISNGLYEFNSTNNLSNYHLSRVTAYFVSGNFIASERNELYGPTDFLANFGGLLGLFTGFSVLSLMEIIYFLTLRLICNIRLYGNWAG